MKPILSHIFDAAKCRQEWFEFDALLKSKSTLSERRDILPFFKKRRNLSLLICNYFPEQISDYDRIAHEYTIDGHFIADLIVGDSAKKNYVLIEFENGRPDSVFSKVGKKVTRDWAKRFEGAYSQLNDWLWKLEDNRSTSTFASVFGSRNARFHGIIIIGKDMALTPQEQERLDWRMDKTLIDSKKVNVISFNQLLNDLDTFLRRFHHV